MYEKIKEEHPDGKTDCDLFKHCDEFGLEFQQSYQYCHIASCSSDVLQASYLIKLEVHVD